jgi:NAD-dependent deacetylase
MEILKGIIVLIVKRFTIHLILHQEKKHQDVNVVWFGEFLPEDQFSSSEAAAEKCDICFVVGTSAVVYPAAQIPLLAHRYGAYLVDINLEWTELAHIADYSFQGKAGDVLPQVLEEVKKQKSS